MTTELEIKTTYDIYEENQSELYEVQDLFDECGGVTNPECFPFIFEKKWVSVESLPDFDSIYKNAYNLAKTNYRTAYNYLMDVVDELKKEVEKQE
jgi:hypothetical protein